MEEEQQKEIGVSVEEKIKKELKPKNKRWWAWTCLGCLVIAIVGWIVLALIGMKLYGQIEQAFTNNKQEVRVYDKWSENDSGDALKIGKYDVVNTNRYKVINTIVLKNDGQGEAQNIEFRLALARDIFPFQDVVAEVILPENYELITDDFHNKYAKFDFTSLSPNDQVTVKAVYDIDVNEVNYNLATCDGELTEGFLEEETYLEVENPQIKNVTEKVTADKENACREAESIYNFVGDNMNYIGYIAEDKGALMALNSKKGDCTDYSDLYIAMARSGGIPSRFVEGINYIKENHSLEDVKHDWTESYLPGIGWVPVDPTWGRHLDTRDEFFARADGKHIILTQGRNLEVLDDAHYFAYNYNWNGKQAKINYEEGWKIDLVEN